MEYVFGAVRRFGEDKENLKTVGGEHSNLSGRVVIRREYFDRIVEDTFYIEEHYESKESDGLCYDWYLINNHNRDTDMFTPQRILERLTIVGQALTDVEITQIECEQMLTDHDIAIMELQMAAEQEQSMSQKIYERYKVRYEWGYCTIEQLRRLVEISALTPEEFKDITGEDYE